MQTLSFSAVIDTIGLLNGSGNTELVAANDLVRIDDLDGRPCFLLKPISRTEKFSVKVICSCDKYPLRSRPTFSEL
jgi:hypothetical protein